MFKLFRRKKDEKGNTVVFFVLSFPAIWLIICATLEFLLYSHVQSTVQSASDAAANSVVACNKEGNASLIVDSMYTKNNIIKTHSINRTTDSLGKNLLHSGALTSQSLTGFNPCRAAADIVPTFPVPAAAETNCQVISMPLSGYFASQATRKNLVSWLAANTETQPISGGKNSNCQLYYQIDAANYRIYTAVVEYQKFVLLPSVFNQGYLRHIAVSSAEIASTK